MYIFYIKSNSKIVVEEFMESNKQLKVYNMKRKEKGTNFTSYSLPSMLVEGSSDLISEGHKAKSVQIWRSRKIIPSIVE